MVKTVDFAAALTSHETHDRLCQEIFLLCKGRPLEKVQKIRDYIQYGSQHPEMAEALGDLVGLLIQLGDPLFVSELSAAIRPRLRSLRRVCA